MIKIQNLSLQNTTTNTTILKNISYEFTPGKITFLVGKSGAGKTSILRCIAQLQKNYTGTILVNDTDIKTFSNIQRAQTIGFVTQQYNLFPQFTVIKNCTIPLCTVLNKSPELATIQATTILETLGIADLANRYPAQLSGGQQQRLALARTLCFDPQILLLDEPSSALDPENTRILGIELNVLAAQGKTIITSSQDIMFVQESADAVLVITDGTIAQSGGDNYGS